MIKVLNFSVQNKQNKKDTFFSNPKFWRFYDFLKLEVFSSGESHTKTSKFIGAAQKLAKNFKVRSQICLFWPEIVEIVIIRL